MPRAGLSRHGVDIRPQRDGIGPAAIQISDRAGFHAEFNQSRPARFAECSNAVRGGDLVKAGLRHRVQLRREAVCLADGVFQFRFLTSLFSFSQPECELENGKTAERAPVLPFWQIESTSISKPENSQGFNFA